MLTFFPKNILHLLEITTVIKTVMYIICFNHSDSHELANKSKSFISNDAPLSSQWEWYFSWSRFLLFLTNFSRFCWTTFISVRAERTLPPQIIYQYYPTTRNLRMSLVQYSDSPGFEMTHTEHFCDMELFESFSYSITAPFILNLSIAAFFLL